MSNFFGEQGRTRIYGPRIAGQEGVLNVRRSRNAARRKKGHLWKLIRSHLKIKILVQDQDGAEFKPAGILKYVEDLKRGSNAEACPPLAGWAKRLF
jgi:hypothetical protein